MERTIFSVIIYAITILIVNCENIKFTRRDVNPTGVNSLSIQARRNRESEKITSYASLLKSIDSSNYTKPIHVAQEKQKEEYSSKTGSISRTSQSSVKATDKKTPSFFGDGKIRYKNVTKSSTRNSGLPFLEIPKGDDMRIQELRLDEEHLIFGAFSVLMGFLQPTGFPLDLLRQTVNKRILPYLAVLQILKLDMTVVIWILIWLVLSLCLLIAVLTQFCCSAGDENLEEDYLDESSLSVGKCTEKFLEYSLHILVFLLIPAIVVMMAANEQIFKSIQKAPESTSIIYEDINTFIRNTHMQISFVVSSSLDITIQDIKEEMEDIVALLGQPYQEEIASEAGIDVALIELDELRLSTSKVTSLVSDLLRDSAEARIAGNMLQEKLDDISLQLTIARQQCNTKDRALCYTLQDSGFEVGFSVQNLTSDPKLRHLDTLAREDSFNGSVDNARKSFALIPDQVALETTPYITETKAILNRKRTEVYKSTHALDVLTRSLLESLRESQETVLPIMHKMMDYDFWRWSIILGIVSLVCLIWSLLLCGAPCGCGVTSKAILLLRAGIGLSSFVIIMVWAMGSFIMVLGGHGQSLLCSPLYDSPNYNILGEIFDSCGILYQDGSFDQFLNGNDTIKITDVLKQCQRDYPVYETFHLHNTINIDNVLNYKQWEDLTVLFLNLSHGECTIEILSPLLQLNLQGLSSASTLNLTTHRVELSVPVTKRDLSSFADQLNIVAHQLTDPGSARQLDNLASNVRKVIHNEVKKLIDIKDRIVYKITALEVLTPSLNRQANNSTENLRAVQSFINNNGSRIASRVRTRFFARLTSYLEELHRYVTKTVMTEIGKCRPLWEIFHSSRFYVCKLIVDPLNAIAFCSFLVIILFLTMAPIVFNLVEHYRQLDGDTTSQRNCLLDEESAWTSPASGTPPEIQLGETVSPVSYERPRMSTWVSPSPPRVPQITSISLPKSSNRGISAISSRISKARQLTQMTMTGSRSPRRGRRNQESLKLVDPICWKVGSTTPRSWI